MDEFIELSITSSNYKNDSELVKRTLREISAMTHSSNDFDVSDYEFTFGWYFFTVRVSKDIVIKFANLLGNEFLKIKGKTLEKRFVNWLDRKLKSLGSNVHIMLKDEFISSKYGLF